MKRIAIFASGNGSNAENIINHFRSKQTAEVVLILTNNKKAFVKVRAERLRIPCITFTSAELKETDAILNRLNEFRIDYIVLAGFLLLIPASIIQTYPKKIINIHPALLPKYGGKGMYGDFVHQAVYHAQEKISGITIHYVNEYYDEGTIIFQTSCSLLPADTPEIIAQKVHELEYKHYPAEIEKIINHSD